MSTSGVDYKLALELKNAGFPQEGKGEKLIYKSSEVGWSTVDNTIYDPTLSELIEACDTRGNELHLWNNEHVADKWMAQWTRDGKLLSGEGKTPRIAVAELWLALNKK